MGRGDQLSIQTKHKISLHRFLRWARKWRVAMAAVLPAGEETSDQRVWVHVCEGWGNAFYLLNTSVCVCAKEPSAGLPLCFFGNMQLSFLKHPCRM